MPKPFSLQRLLELAQARAEESSRVLGRLIAEEREAKERLEILERYRSEYLEKYREAQAKGLNKQAWNNYNGFIKRLDTAVAQQTTTLQSARQRTAQGQQAWHNENRQMNALKTLSTRHKQREQYLEARSEQKALDEFSAHKYLHSLSFGTPKE